MGGTVSVKTSYNRPLAFWFHYAVTFWYILKMFTSLQSTICTLSLSINVSYIFTSLRIPTKADNEWRVTVCFVEDCTPLGTKELPLEPTATLVERRDEHFGKVLNGNVHKKSQSPWHSLCRLTRTCVGKGKKNVIEYKRERSAASWVRPIFTKIITPFEFLISNGV